MASPRLTLADQAFLHAAAVIAASVRLDTERADLALAMIDHYLPQTTRGHAYLEPVAVHIEAMLAAARSGASTRERSEAYASARYRAGLALADLWFWRLGLAHDELARKEAAA